MASLRAFAGRGEKDVAGSRRQRAGAGASRTDQRSATNACADRQSAAAPQDQGRSAARPFPAPALISPAPARRPAPVPDAPDQEAPRQKTRGNRQHLAILTRQTNEGFPAP